MGANNPNQRFAASFLDVYLKQHSVDGEVLMNKQTGQIYIKRKEDGKVTTYFQLMENIYDSMLELTILFKNYPIKSPNTTLGAFTSTDFNVIDVLQGTLPNIMYGEYIDIPTSVVDENYKIDFKLSKATDAFFIKLSSRTIDGNFIEVATTMYDDIFKNYTGDDTTYLAEKAKFSDPTYEASNATATYTITFVADYNGITQNNTLNVVQNLRINERAVCYLPAEMFNNYTNIASINVSLSRVTFPKFKPLLDYIDANPDTITTAIDRCRPADDRIIIEYLNESCFIDDINDIPVTDTSETIYLFDISFLETYIGRTNKISDSPSFIISGTEPTDAVWTSDTIWGELIRRADGNGVFTDIPHDTDIPALIDYMYTNTGARVIFTDNPALEEDILVTDEP